MTEYKVRCLDCKSETSFISSFHLKEMEEEFSDILQWIKDDHNGHRIKIEKVSR